MSPPLRPVPVDVLAQKLHDLRELAASDEGRQLIAERLEQTLRRSKIGGEMLDKIRLMYDYFRDPAEAMGPKLLIGAALLYLINPFDLVPESLFGLLGFVDDLVAIRYIWSQLRDIMTNYDRRRRLRQDVIIMEG